MTSDGAAAVFGGGPPVRHVRQSERGAGAVLMVSIMAVVMVVAVAASELAAGYRARHQAAAAADLAALAAARQLGQGEADPCAVADQVSVANGGELRDCLVNGSVVEVQVRVRVNAGLGWLTDQQRRARAGPTH